MIYKNLLIKSFLNTSYLKLYLCSRKSYHSNNNYTYFNINNECLVVLLILSYSNTILMCSYSIVVNTCLINVVIKIQWIIIINVNFNYINVLMV